MTQISSSRQSKSVEGIYAQWREFRGPGGVLDRLEITLYTMSPDEELCRLVWRDDVAGEHRMKMVPSDGVLEFY